MAASVNSIDSTLWRGAMKKRPTKWKQWLPHEVDKHQPVNEAETETAAVTVWMRSNRSIRHCVRQPLWTKTKSQAGRQFAFLDNVQIK